MTTPTSNTEEAEGEQSYEDLQDLLEITPKKGVLFIIGDWNAKVGSQETPGVTGKFGLGVLNEAAQRLIEFCQENKHTGHSKHPLPTTQEKTTHGHHQMVDTKIRLIIFFAPKDEEALYSLQKQDWELTVAQIHELLFAKFRHKLKKVGKTTRPFRYDLNKISCDYTVEVRNRFKGLDLIDRVPDELWMEVVTLYRAQESRPSPKKRNAKKQNGCLQRRPYKQL